MVFGLRTASARVFSAYGPGLRRQVMWDIVHKALTQPEIRLQGTGQESRDFIHAQDIARGLESILNHAPLLGEGYNLACGSETHIVDLAASILSEIENPPPLTFSGELPPGTPQNWLADIALISGLGFRPEISIEAGVADFVEWSRHEIKGV
jgi:UDP-glucose 4-epimerase